MILITGATGNIGSALIQQSTAAGIPVRALVRSSAKAQQIKTNSVEIAIGDFSQPAQLKSALQGVKKLFLLSSLEPQLPQLQQQAIQIAKQMGVEHVVKLSVEGADPQSKLMVYRWHGEVEKYLEASGMAWTHLRPGYFMQNLLMSAATIKSQNSFFTVHDEMTVAIDARDIAAVAFETLTQSGHEQQVYHLTGAEVLSFTDMLQQLGQIIGRKLQLVQLTPADYRQGMASAGLPEWLLDFLMEMAIASPQTPLIADTVPVITKRSPILFRQFAEDYATAFR
ncbi:MAG: hypothetical protein RLZZ135_760 [Cyanobacteriota bacterium]|jgi:uncharacterized protein YbjT (DUF2867 family)